MVGPPVAFSEEQALHLARKAAAAAGLAGEPARLIRIGENAIVRLPRRVVARIARGPGWFNSARFEVSVARALEQAGASTARVTPGSDQPLMVDGHPVTFWREIPGPLREATVEQLGAALRGLHAVDAPFDVPSLDPWGRTAERIDAVKIPELERAVLRSVFDDLAGRWSEFRSELGEGLIHGDAHLGNLAVGTDGVPVLVDLETVCRGPREWDLVPTGLYARSLGWIDADEYAGFVRAYGYDVTRSMSFDLLARMRELRMTAWLAQHATESERTAREVTHRIACLADPAMPRRWSPR